MATRDALPAEGVFAERRCRLAVIVLMLVALALRLATLDYALPCAQEPDPHILGQVESLSQEVVTERDIFYSSIYPHLLARTAMLAGDVTKAPEDLATLDLDEHLEAAGRLHVRVRWVVALFSILSIPATWWIARQFLEPRWALFAAALMAVSTLSLQFGQQARPHAAVAALIALAVGALLELRRRGDTRSFVVAGALLALAIACLTNALALLLPALVAYLLRDGAKRRVLDARFLIPLAFLALAIWRFYPFFFVPTPPEEQQVVEDASIRLAWQTIDFSDFAGQGFPTLFATLWYYEPVALLLAIAGAATWLVRRRPSSGRAKDLVVVLSYALTYAVVIGLYRRNQQRFVLPLVPFVAVLAAYGLRGAFEVVGSRAARIALAALALAVPTLACAGYTRIRMRPQTLQITANWIRANVDREHERVAIHLLYDVPLARRHANLFEPDGRPKSITFSPWLKYQRLWMDSVWSGERWDIESLYPDRARWAWIAKNAPEYVSGLDADLVIVPGGDGVGVNALTRAVRDELGRIGTKVYELPAETRPEPSGLEGLDTPHFTWFVLTAHWFGPQIDVYRIARNADPRK